MKTKNQSFAGWGFLPILLLAGSVGALEMDRIGFLQCTTQSSIGLLGLYLIGRK